MNSARKKIKIGRSANSMTLTAVVNENKPVIRAGRNSEKNATYKITKGTLKPIRRESQIMKSKTHQYFFQKHRTLKLFMRISTAK